MSKEREDDMYTRKKIWNDRVFAEQWEFNGQQVLRHKPLVSYPWRYLIGQFNKDHTVPADNSKYRPMTQGEINSFKSARLLK